MKALILSGGKGSRLRPITYSLAKQLVPIANKPVIEYGLNAIIEAGIKDVGIVVGDTAEEIMATLGDGSRWNIKITYVHQDAPLGLAHAVKIAQPFLGEDDFIMYLGDNLLKSSLTPLVENFQKHKPEAIILLTPVPNASDFGVAVMRDNQVIELEEKPKKPKSNLALVGVYLFSKSIHPIINHLKPSKRGELEITEAIQGLINRKQLVIAQQVQGWWKDTGTVESMLDANRIVLEDATRDIQGKIDSRSKIEGNVVVEPGASIVNSIILGPVVIGKDCVVQESYVGPFTSIANNTKIIKTEIQNSIVMHDCHLENLNSRVESSLLGRGVKLYCSNSLPRSINVVIGDCGSVHLP
jgi:glucose-1-phosphate thymidylyltransferase